MKIIFFTFFSLCIAILSLDGQAASVPSTKSIVPPIVEEFKSIKEAKEAKAKKIADAQLKEEPSADEVAAKIAEKLALLRKEKANQARNAARLTLSSSLPKQAKKTESVNANKSSHEWSYEGENGAFHWAKLSPANTLCESGERQSPIDIREGIRVDLDLLRFEYQAAQFNVLDNGHTIQVSVNSGHFLNVSGKNYELIQFHFHKPSEERINGKGFPMVVHLVHKDVDGKFAVVAIMIEVGKANNIIQTVWNNLPLEKKMNVKALQEIDMQQILPKSLNYYTYMGSLTTPPCSEGVLWIVMKESIEISSEQLAIFARLYPMNARPIQKSFNRLIKESR